MKEIELKFQIPPESAQDVSVQLQALQAESVRLAARYFDTADRLLAQAGFALRLRLEGAQWVQTLKGRAAGSAGLIERIEHNAPLDGVPADTLPALDLQRHAGTPAGSALLALLSGAGVGVEALQLQYETDITRLQQRVQHASAGIELAFDLGLIRSGERRLTVCELEFELLDGPRADLIDAARAWVQAHGLWLDVRSKAERGDRLARDVSGGRAVPARELPAQAALPELLGLALAQILPNLADVADDMATPPQRQGLQQGVAELRRALLARADAADALPAAQILAEAPAQTDVAATLRSPAVQAVVLDLLGRSLGRG